MARSSRPCGFRVPDRRAVIDSLGKLLVDPLAERWKSAAFGGSLVLWLFIAAIALFTRGIRARPGDWPVNCHIIHVATRPAWCALPPAGQAGAVIVAATGAVIATAFLAQALAPGALRLIQGEAWRTWPYLPVVPRMIQSHYRDVHAANYPTDAHPGQLRPTRVGNRFAALDERVTKKFGLKLAIVWDALVASLPQDARDALAASSRSLLLACQNLLISGVAAIAAIVVIPGGWSRPVVPIIALLATICLWRALAGAADEYCDLLMTTLMLHGDSLYTALGEAPPQPGNDVRQRGAHLTKKVQDIIR